MLVPILGEIATLDGVAIHNLIAMRPIMDVQGIYKGHLPSSFGTLLFEQCFHLFNFHIKFFQLPG
jgi:hypothetical protein